MVFVNILRSSKSFSIVFLAHFFVVYLVIMHPYKTLTNKHATLEKINTYKNNAGVNVHCLLNTKQLISRGKIRLTTLSFSLVNMIKFVEKDKEL